MRWAIVVGIDEYGDEGMRLSAAVSDARSFRDWVVRSDGGGVPESNVRLLLSPSGDSDTSIRAATKDNIVSAIDEVVVAAGDQQQERLYFYFAGHGITAWVSNRDEAALVTPGFSELHTDHSLAVRSIAEFLETTPFADQFLFLDACRNIPWADRAFEVGRWPVPRRRDPGAPPTQQFILYATAPGHTAEEVGWPGEAQGAFTSALLESLKGTDNAKAWSWERNCYEVRWERLASFINERMKARLPAGMSEMTWRAQIPQDSGTRGVASRERDVVVVSFPSGTFPPTELTVELALEAKHKNAQVSVLDALGEPVASVLGVTGESQKFRLAPKTYAVRATAPKGLIGSVRAPIELYHAHTTRIELRPQDAPPDEHSTTGTIAVESADPLSVAEIVDEAGRVVAVTPAGEVATVPLGFYRVRHIGPDAARDAGSVVLSAGASERLVLPPGPLDPMIDALTSKTGGGVKDGYVNIGEDMIAWARPSTVVAEGAATYLAGLTPASTGLEGAATERERDKHAGVAVFAVGRGTDGGADPELVQHLKVAIWPAGEPVVGSGDELEPTDAGVARRIVHVRPIPHWVAFTAPGAAPMVVSVPVLPQRMATLVAQVDRDRIRLHQYHPRIGDGTSSAGRLWRVEYLQRMLLGGRIDIADRLTRQLAETASVDPFAGLVAGYVLLRLGRYEELGELASAVVAAAPTLSDAYILRAEHESRMNRPAIAEQAFINAVDSGIPTFGEGLTRLLEGLRATRLALPRAALFRYIFQRHARGSMWAAFTPGRALEQGRSVISAADLGFEA